tara:strand:+ start:1420 stop:1566 length:147 start_codon:yes stop_codon:yes gene_type:complete
MEGALKSDVLSVVTEFCIHQLSQSGIALPDPGVYDRYLGEIPSSIRAR